MHVRHGAPGLGNLLGGNDVKQFEKKNLLLEIKKLLIVEDMFPMNITIYFSSILLLRRHFGLLLHREAR